MRICSGLLCDRKAKVWMRGKAWCIPCSIKRFGIVAPPPDGAAPGSGAPYSPQETAGSGSPEPSGNGPPKSFPSSEREASTSASVGASEPPAPLITDNELLDTLATHGLLDPIDLEWELVQRLEGVE